MNEPSVNLKKRCTCREIMTNPTVQLIEYFIRMAYIKPRPCPCETNHGEGEFLIVFQVEKEQKVIVLGAHCLPYTCFPGHIFLSPGQGVLPKGLNFDGKFNQS